METKKELREHLNNVEENAIRYFKKLNKIENIIRVGQSEKTPAIFIVDKIKEVIKI